MNNHLPVFTVRITALMTVNRYSILCIDYVCLYTVVYFQFRLFHLACLDFYQYVPFQFNHNHLDTYCIV